MTVTAFFDNRTDAEEAVRALHAAGVSRDSIRLVPGHERDEAEGADAPSLGEASVSFWDSLRDLFLPDEDRTVYAEGLCRGGYLVSVNATEAEHELVLDILDDEGTIDIDERANSWRAEGWSGSSTAEALSGATANLTSSSSAPGLSPAGADRAGRGEAVIPVAEEHLNVGKRDVSHGRVRVRSYVVETPVNEQVNFEERVEVERRPADRGLHSVEDAFQERTIEMEEHREEPVVSKEARVKELLVVKKDVEQRTETVSGTVRSTEVEVEDERGNTVSKTGTKDRT
jgi:stress response protein YsnF